MTDARPGLRVVIRGRVQGVGFRAWLQREAARHGVSGWVGNDPDGSVEAVLVGEPGAIEAVLAACHQGPRSARVDQVERQPTDEADLRDVVAGTFGQRRAV